MGSFRNSKELQSRTCDLWGSTGNSRDKGEEQSFIEEKGELGGAVTNKKAELEETGNFHWLSCDSLSLAGLLLGREKCFLPLAEW